MITAQELKRAVNAAEVIGNYVQLKKSGKRYIACCPFHDDRNPSFSLDPDNGLFYCFGCGTGGDIIRFLERIEGLDFRGAFRRLGDIVGVPVEAGKGHLDPTIEVKLSAKEAWAFDSWLDLKKHRLQHLWSMLDDNRRACETFLDAFWDEDDPNPEMVEAFHKQMNQIHEGKQLIDEQLDCLEMDPASMVEPFLRGFYGDQDFRKEIEGL